MSCSSLAVPPGGRLVDLRVPPAERAAVEEAAGDARSILLKPEACVDLLWLTWGARSPATRFETPIGTSGRFAPPRLGEVTALRDALGHLLAVLTVGEVESDGDGAGGALRIAGHPRVLDAPVPPALRPLCWRPAEVREVLERHGRSPVLGWYGHEPPEDEVVEQGLSLAAELGGVFLAVVAVPSEATARARRAAEIGALGERLRSRAVVAAGPPTDDAKDADVRILRTYGAERVLVPEGVETDANVTAQAFLDAFGGMPA